MRTIAPTTALILGTAIAMSTYERQGLASAGFAIMAENYGTFLVASILGFVVNVSTNLLLVCVGSGLSLKVFGATKNAVLVVLGCLIFKERTSLMQIIGYLISILGFFAYTKRLSDFEQQQQQDERVFTAAAIQEDTKRQR